NWPYPTPKRPVPNILFGTLTSLDLNAEMLPVPPTFACKSSPTAVSSKFDDRIVVVNTRLLDFSQLLTKILLQTIRLESQNETVSIDYSKEALTKAIRDNSSLLENFEAAFTDFLMIAPARPTVPIDESMIPLITVIRDGIEQFVVAHEL